MTSLVLDTNILVGLLRNAPYLDEADRRTGLLDPNAVVAVPIVAVGEIRSLAYQFGWGPRKKAALTRLLARFPTTGLTPDIVDRYAEIDAFSQGKHPARPLGTSARNMGKNDLWIAATASVTHATLVTTDRDFDHLDGEFLALAWVDPTSA